MSAKFAFIDAEKALVLDREDVRLDRRVHVGLLRVARPATLGDRAASGPPGHPHRADLHRLRQTYGHRRIHAALARQGERVTPELVRAIMRELGLVPCQPRPLRPTTTVAGARRRDPRPGRRDFTADAPGTKLVGDITYLPTWQGWLYLATVIDCHTKACIGYALAKHLRADLVIDALTDGRPNYTLADGAIFHSDRGTQYTSQSFAEAAAELGVRRSVGRTGVMFR